jgi:hypothetical protein
MADIENDLAMAEPALALRKPLLWEWEDKVRDFLERYKTANHGSSEEDDAVAVAAEPQEHTRWILIAVVSIGAFFIFVTAICKSALDHDENIFSTMLWAGVAVCPALFAGFLVAECGCLQDLLPLPFPDDEEHQRLVDCLLQL